MRRRPAQIEREYGPFAPPPAAAHGVTFDGERVWVATGEALVGFDPVSGDVQRTLAVTATAGTAFDGKCFFQLTGKIIQKIDAQTGAILATLPSPFEGDCSGMTWAEGSLWIGQYAGRAIHRVDPDTGQILRTIRSDRFVTGVTFAEGDLWHGVWEEGKAEIRRIAKDTGEVAEILEMPVGTMVSGLESDGGERFFAGGGPTGKVRAVRRPPRSALASGRMRKPASALPSPPQSLEGVRVFVAIVRAGTLSAPSSDARRARSAASSRTTSPRSASARGSRAWPAPREA